MKHVVLCSVGKQSVNEKGSSDNVFNRKIFFARLSLLMPYWLYTSVSSQSELRGVFSLSNLVGSLAFGFRVRVLGKQLSGKGRRGNWVF